MCYISEIARHQLEQQRLGERLREQEERLKGLNAAQGGTGLLPMFGQIPAPLFPPIGVDAAARPEVVCESSCQLQFKRVTCSSAGTCVIPACGGASPPP